MRLSFSTLPTLVSLATAAYFIQDDCLPSNFGNMFDFITDNDPTNGYVSHISQSAAQDSGLYSIGNGAVYIGVDSSRVGSGRGRDSIRISSKKLYNYGLIILDLVHMPAGAWTPNCDVNAPGQATNAGCSIRNGSTESFGPGFNAICGGVYATEWNSEAVSIWFFPRGAIPADITAGTPNSDTGALPSGSFGAPCNIGDHVVNQQIVFDVTFCGDWAGNVWSSDTVCAPKAPTCQQYIQNNPSAFQDTYRSINSLKVYSGNGAAPAPSSIRISTQLSSIIPPSNNPTTIPLVSTATPQVPLPSLPITIPSQITVAIPLPPTTFQTITQAPPPITTQIPDPVYPVPTQAPVINPVPVFPTTAAVPTVQAPVPATTVAGGRGDRWGGGGRGGTWSGPRLRRA